MDKKDISRRDFIQRMTLFGAAGIGAGSLLASCGGGEQPAATPSETPAPAAPEAPAADTFSCMDTSGLNEQELAARTNLHYVDESTVDGKDCENCALYVAAAEGAQCGTCQTIKGPIHPRGYCDIWSAKTA